MVIPCVLQLEKLRCTLTSYKYKITYTKYYTYFVWEYSVMYELYHAHFTPAGHLSQLLLNLAALI